VPRLVERTVHQVELARSLAIHLPCVGSVLGARRTDVGPGQVLPEPITVLDLFEPAGGSESAAGPADDTAVADHDTSADVVAPVEDADSAVVTESAATASASTATAADVPAEIDLAVPDYDSLAASQVVPRLAMLSVEDLRAVRAYEQAHRHRQTILNRVAQLLEA
jgi:hypothetical protein